METIKNENKINDDNISKNLKEDSNNNISLLLGIKKNSQEEFEKKYQLTNIILGDGATSSVQLGKNKSFLIIIIFYY